ncbi:hypothetical protein BS47DRAFT_1312257 [Hydnum rufescens UP504]|uniref:CMP/dCMP-type deaminase domain-containing protein n=1 Tax=Hydnum rufescens UP504 TaxID=1448309 RepID=A0A9P6B8G3_9AGAM|nr:hypothetical protein BS47DRAFT_1312257 [Hydnum rufescens UP504]
MIKWAENSGLNDDSLEHLRSVRKGSDKITGAPSISILLGPSYPDRPFPIPLESLPQELSKPYKTLVPSYPSRSPAQIRAKNLVWPCLYQPRRPSASESYDWSEIEIDWIANCIERVLKDSQRSRDAGDLGISSLVSSFDHPDIEFVACDTRRTTHHPLRHSVMNVIRQVADFQVEQSIVPTPLTSGDSPSRFMAAGAAPVSEPLSSATTPLPYLLTNMTLFTSHEPCIMCSMALVHSRLARVFFVRDMPLTGGCGGVVGVSGGAGVNHRYDIYQWLGDGKNAEGGEKYNHTGAQDTVEEYIDA